MNALDKVVWEAQSLDRIFHEAKKNGCRPLWAETPVGTGWHCSCRDLRHSRDHYCSLITETSAMKGRTHHE